MPSPSDRIQITGSTVMRGEEEGAGCGCGSKSRSECKERGIAVDVAVEVGAQKGEGEWEGEEPDDDDDIAIPRAAHLTWANRSIHLPRSYSPPSPLPFSTTTHGRESAMGADDGDGGMGITMQEAIFDERAR